MSRHKDVLSPDKVVDGQFDDAFDDATAVHVPGALPLPVSVPSAAIQENGKVAAIMPHSVPNLAALQAIVCGNASLPPADDSTNFDPVSQLPKILPQPPLGKKSASLPQASLPQAPSNQVSLPQASLPQASLPHASLPQASLPQMSMPQMPLAQMPLPQLSNPADPLNVLFQLSQCVLNPHPLHKNVSVPNQVKMGLLTPSGAPAFPPFPALQQLFTEPPPPPVEEDKDKKEGVVDAKINVQDVLCGRGGFTNSHFGNILWRKLVRQYRLDYTRTTKKSRKAEISKAIVWTIRKNGGRFLKRDDEGNNEGVWFEIGDFKAREKTSQQLREKDSTSLIFPTGAQVAIHVPTKRDIKRQRVD